MFLTIGVLIGAWNWGAHSTTLPNTKDYLGLAAQHGAQNSLSRQGKVPASVYTMEIRPGRGECFEGSIFMWFRCLPLPMVCFLRKLSHLLKQTWGLQDIVFGFSTSHSHIFILSLTCSFLFVVIWFFHLYRLRHCVHVHVHTCKIAWVQATSCAKQTCPRADADRSESISHIHTPNSCTRFVISVFSASLQWVTIARHSFKYQILPPFLLVEVVICKKVAYICTVQNLQPLETSHWVVVCSWWTR